MGKTSQQQMQLNSVPTLADENIRVQTSHPKEEATKLFAGLVKTPVADAVGQGASLPLKDGMQKK